jgi:hypothetical protein
MSMQQSGPEASQPSGNIPLRYHLVVEGDSTNPIFDLEGLDGNANSHLKKSSGKTPIIECPYGPDWYAVSIKLKDGGMNLRFNANRPIDAHDKSSCPAQFSGVHTDQLKHIDVAGNEITIVNANQVEGEIGYSLNLVDKDGKDFPRFDPIFQNNGGGH